MRVLLFWLRVLTVWIHCRSIFPPRRCSDLCFSRNLAVPLLRLTLSSLTVISGECFWCCFWSHWYFCCLVMTWTPTVLFWRGRKLLGKGCPYSHSKKGLIWASVPGWKEQYIVRTVVTGAAADSGVLWGGWLVVIGGHAIWTLVDAL